MKFFTIWLNGEITEPYKSCIDDNKAIVSDMEVVSYPVGYPLKDDQAPLWWESDKLRIWLLAEIYRDQGIYIDADCKLNSVPYLPEGKVLVARHNKTVDSWMLGHNKASWFFSEVLYLLEKDHVEWSLQLRILPDLCRKFYKHIEFINVEDVDHAFNTHKSN